MGVKSESTAPNTILSIKETETGTEVEKINEELPHMSEESGYECLISDQRHEI